MRIVAEGGDYILQGVVVDGAELDGTFRLLTDDGESLYVNSWLFVIEILDDQVD